jgi:glutamate synthase domain-containing protein 3
VKDINKCVQDLKREIETIKKIQSKAIIEMENLRMRTGTTDLNITNRIHEMEERISGIEDVIEEINISVKENAKSNETKHLENWEHYEKTKIKIIRTEKKNSPSRNLQKQLQQNPKRTFPLH